MIVSLTMPKTVTVMAGMLEQAGHGDWRGDAVE
jgi:hypothetical protein